MSQRKRWIYEIAAVAGALLIIFAGVLASFDIAVYGDPKYRFYEKEYIKYQVTEPLEMELEDVMNVTKYMMSYLRGQEQELSIVTTVEGKKQDFFNEQDRFHMEEVKGLFLGGLKLMRISFIIGLVLLGWIGWKTERRYGIVSKAVLTALGLFAAAAILLGSFCYVNFTKIFEIFHEIFFDNDLWLFDPATDYMIRMLPEGFFFDMVVRIGRCFGIFFVLLLLGAVVRRYFYRRTIRNE